MKQAIYLTLLILTCSIVNLGQETKVVAGPVEGSKPFIMTRERLENLDVPASMDRLGKVDNNTKKARLDLFTSLISPENKTVEFVIQLRGETKQEVSKNMDFIYNYLIEKKKIKPGRISFGVAPEGEESMEFWLIPNKNVSIPTCQDCSVIRAEDEEKLKEYFQLKKSKK